MCLFDLLVITILKVPEPIVSSSIVTSPSYMLQLEYVALCLKDGSNTQLLPRYAFLFTLGILHLK